MALSNSEQGSAIAGARPLVESCWRLAEEGGLGRLIFSIVEVLRASDAVVGFTSERSIFFTSLPSPRRDRRRRRDARASNQDGLSPDAVF